VLSKYTQWPHDARDQSGAGELAYSMLFSMDQLLSNVDLFLDFLTHGRFWRSCARTNRLARHHLSAWRHSNEWTLALVHVFTRSNFVLPPRQLFHQCSRIICHPHEVCDRRDLPVRGFTSDAALGIKKNEQRPYHAQHAGQFM
jgi:hypothetical protein